MSHVFRALILLNYDWMKTYIVTMADMSQPVMNWNGLLPASLGCLIIESVLCWNYRKRTRNGRVRGQNVRRGGIRAPTQNRKSPTKIEKLRTNLSVRGTRSFSETPKGLNLTFQAFTQNDQHQKRPIERSIDRASEWLSPLTFSS